MMTLLAFTLTLLGFAALALAMDRHHRQVRRTAPAGWLRWLLRGVGTLALAASLAACVADSGWGTGWVVWFGLLSAAATMIVLSLTYWPQRIAPPFSPSMPSQPGKRTVPSQPGGASENRRVLFVRL